MIMRVSGIDFFFIGLRKKTRIELEVATNGWMSTQFSYPKEKENPRNTQYSFNYRTIAIRNSTKKTNLSRS